MPGCYKKYTDPSSLRKHVKNHSKEEQDQYKMYRERNLAAEQLWSQQENAAASSNSDQHTFIPGIIQLSRFITMRHCCTSRNFIQIICVHTLLLMIYQVWNIMELEAWQQRAWILWLQTRCKCTHINKHFNSIENVSFK